MDPATTSSAFGKIIEMWGLPGALLVLANYFIYHLYKRNNDLQDARLQEVREHAKQNSELARDLSKALDNVTQAVNSLRDLMLARRSLHEE